VIAPTDIVITKIIAIHLIASLTECTTKPYCPKILIFIVVAPDCANNDEIAPKIFGTIKNDTT
jgi:hypothetical protein